MQTTIASTVGFSGFGLHSGAPARIVVRPAPPGHGVRFRRTDIRCADNVIPALWPAVAPSRLCTRLANEAGAEVSTVEHLLAALAGAGVTNVLVDVDGPEIPILDGSAAPFFSGLLRAGLRRQAAALTALRILAPVGVEHGEASARLEPAEGFEVDFAIAFPDSAIGHQTRRLALANGAFARELADSRTFCRRAEVEAMQADGLALGGTFENAVVVDGPRVLSPGGLRHADEPVRHKMLDAVGDLSLAGAPIIGRYVGRRAGHALTAELLRALFAQPGAARCEQLTPAERAQVPGAGHAAADHHAVA